MLLHELDRSAFICTKRIAVHPLFAGGGKLCLVLPCRGKERRTHFLAGGFVGTKIYKDTQSKLVTEMEQKANDSDLREKIKNADAVAADIFFIPLSFLFSFIGHFPTNIIYHFASDLSTENY